MRLLVVFGFLFACHLAGGSIAAPWKEVNCGSSIAASDEDDGEEAFRNWR